MNYNLINERITQSNYKLYDNIIFFKKIKNKIISLQKLDK